MDIVPFYAATGDSEGQRSEAAANQYFLQLLQENRQVNIFLQDPRIQEALELQAERRHAFVLDNVYSEASSYISRLEASADEAHRQQLSFIRQSTEVLVGQLNSENKVFRQIAEAESRTALTLQAQLAHSDRECREERVAARQLGAQCSEAQMLARTLAAENRQHEHERIELRTSFDQNRAQTIRFLGEEFEEKLQWEENEYHYHLTSEAQQYDNLIADLEDRNAELIAEVNSLRSVLTTGQNSPPQGGAVPVIGVDPGESSAKPSSPPQGGASASGVQGPGHPWVPTLPNPREIPQELRNILGRTQKFEIGDPVEDKAPEAEGSTAEQSEANEPNKPKEATEILAEALKAAIKKPEDDDKPKAKEAETVKLPDFPNPETYRSWKISVREAVRAASDKPDEAFKWVQEVYDRTASMEHLRETGKFLTLDTKILSALSRVAKGDLARQIINFKESEATVNRAVRGRQVLLMFEHYFKTNEEAGSLYSIEDLLKVQLSGDDLSTFIHNWESVIAGLNHQPEETTLRDILLRQLRSSGKLKFDLEVYDRAKEGSEQRTYEYLVKCVKELLTRDRSRKNRNAIAKAHGAKFGAPAPAEATTPRGRSQDKPCYAFQRGKCPRGDKCPYKHVKAEQTRGKTPPRSPSKGGKGSGKGGKGKEKKDTSKIPCLFYPKGTCKNGKNCPFMHRDASPSVPAKGDGDKGGKPRSPSPKRRRSKKRGKSADKKATCCLSSTATLTGEPSACSNTRFALAARKGEAFQRDHWVVDERKGTCTRVHQKYRSCLYAPQPEHCPVPFWRLKCNVEVRMYHSECSRDFVEKTFNFKTHVPKEPMDRWIGTTTFYLKPKVMKVQFQRPEIIDIAPEGEGWKFVVEKRKYNRKYKTSDDCPIPDPDDSNDALENALFLESAVKGMKLGVRVKCGYRCRGREGFCTKCKDAVAPPTFAAAAVNHEANLEIIADTGSEEDLISHSDLEVHFRDKARKIPSTPISLITANGAVDADTKHEVYVEALKDSLQFVELPSTPAVCSVGKKCMEQGFSFHWPTGEAPYFINPNGQKVQCQLRGNVPVFGDRGPLISCPAAASTTKDGTRVAPTSVSNEAGFR